MGIAEHLTGKEDNRVSVKMALFLGEMAERRGNTVPFVGDSGQIGHVQIERN